MSSFVDAEKRLSEVFALETDARRVYESLNTTHANGNLGESDTSESINTHE